MRNHNWAVALLALAVTAGCSQQRANETEAEKTRQDAQQAGSEVRQDSQAAGNEARQTAEEAGAATRDAANDVRDQARDAGAKLEERTRDERAQIKEGAKEAAQKTRAAVGGFVEGWREGDAAVNLNSATQADLERTGLTPAEAKAVIAGRPYNGKRDVVQKGIIPEERFQQLEARVTVK